MDWNYTKKQVLHSKCVSVLCILEHQLYIKEKK